jgi:glycosyltransferase involved in cell wall biosynthesis
MFSGVTFDDRRMRIYENFHASFDTVVHIVHGDWHGIRKAAAYCPGHKLLIPAYEPISDDVKKEIARTLDQAGIKRIIFQGYSNNADELAVFLRATLDESVRLFVVTHVTSAQFDNYFEMEMQARLFMRIRFGTFDRLGSVKPDFSAAFPDYWPKTLLNFAPAVTPGQFTKPKVEAGYRTYIPLDVGWRKNMYTNALGCLITDRVERVDITNFPKGLESISDLSKLRMVGYLRGDTLLAHMAKSSVLVMGTLAECQPTTQVEALAVGTPVMTRMLGVSDFEDDPLSELTEMATLDNPRKISDSVNRLLDVMESDANIIPQMIRAHLKKRHAIGFERYAEFVDL